MHCSHASNCVSIICLLLLCGLQTCKQCVQSAVHTVVNVLQLIVSGNFESLHSLQISIFWLHSRLAEVLWFAGVCLIWQACTSYDVQAGEVARCIMYLNT